MPYPNSANSALVSSSGWAGACMNVPETFNLRSASPSAVRPLSADTIENVMRFWARGAATNAAAATRAAPAAHFTSRSMGRMFGILLAGGEVVRMDGRSEEHTSELQ